MKGRRSRCTVVAMKERRGGPVGSSRVKGQLDRLGRGRLSAAKHVRGHRRVIRTPGRGRHCSSPGRGLNYAAPRVRAFDLRGRSR